jgi:hypothetical protein
MGRTEESGGERERERRVVYDRRSQCHSAGVSEVWAVILKEQE